MLPKFYSPERCVTLLQGIRDGVPIGRVPANSIIHSPNWPSAIQYHSKVSEIIVADLEAGKLHGPFSSPPYDHYIVSPLGAFPKRDPSKIRVIHDLSHPFESSVNSLIPPEDYSLQYSTIDTAVEACRAHSSPMMGNIDLQDAYKAVGVRLEDWHLLGFTWDLDGSGEAFYFSRVLSFGLRSAPALFDQYAGALEKFMTHEGVAESIVRYVDDFLLVRGDRDTVNSQLDIMIMVARRAGFSIQDKKVTRASQVVEFLGIVIDIPAGILRISDTRLAEVKALLARWSGTRWATKRALLKLVGKLAFAARVVRTGRAFLGRLIGLSKKVSKLYHRVRLSESAQRDIQWWIQCIDTHNGTPIAKVDWAIGPVIDIYTDASNFGYGGVCRNEWFAMAYTGQAAPLGSRSINWRELHAAVKALATWGPALGGQKVVFHIDNSTTCYILARMYTPVPELMDLVRSWCLLIEKVNIVWTARYISTHDNVRADLLSRGEIEKFKAVQGPGESRIWPQPVSYFDDIV